MSNPFVGFRDAEAHARADKWLDRAQQRTDELADALDVLAHIVSQANVNPVTATDEHGEYIARYDLPVGSIHKAIPFLHRFGVVVDQYGVIHKGPNCPVRISKPEPRVGGNGNG